MVEAQLERREVQVPRRLVEGRIESIHVSNYLGGWISMIVIQDKPSSPRHFSIDGVVDSGLVGKSARIQEHPHVSDGEHLVVRQIIESPWPGPKYIYESYKRIPRYH